MTNATKDLKKYIDQPVPHVPGRIPLMDVHYVIRFKAQVYGFAGFTYYSDAKHLMKHLKAMVGNAVIYELMDAVTGEVLETTFTPS